MVFHQATVTSELIVAARPLARAGAGLGALSDEGLRTYAETRYRYYGRFEIDEA